MVRKIPAPEPKPVKPPTKLALYKKKLASHDWHFEYADDMRSVRTGRATEAALLAEAKESTPAFMRAFEKARDKARKKT